jgi:deoxyribonuclease V
VWDRVEKKTLEVSRVKRELNIPYVPGFLSFREGPALHDAIAKLKHPFDAILFDGQGRAHPRRCGLATHMGVELNCISVGAAKSLYVGEYDEPDGKLGAQSKLMHNGEQMGVVLRTRQNVKPMFISIGNRTDLKSAVKLVMACCTTFRMPEPTRLADIEVALCKAQDSQPVARASRS